MFSSVPGWFHLTSYVGGYPLVGNIIHISTQAKSLYRSRAERHFYGTENMIWAGLWPIGNTEKKWAIMRNF